MIDVIAEMIAMADELDAAGEHRRAAVLDSMIRSAIQMGNFFPPDMVPEGTLDEPQEDLQPAVLPPGARRYSEEYGGMVVDKEAGDRFVEQQTAFYVSKGMSQEEARSRAFADLFPEEN